jgi:hypothetical protein
MMAKDDENKGGDVQGATPDTPTGEVPVVRRNIVEGSGVATLEQNAKLEHSQGGRTTRDDAADLGVPMLPGSPDEPAGPEDALGEGPTRGDYRERLGGSGYNPHETRPTRADEHRDGAPGVVMEAQKPRAEEIGDVAGKKGGVDTADARARR